MTLEEMLPALRCPRCGHEHTLQPQDVVETLTVGTTVIQVPVLAGVCSFCGEHVFDSVATDKVDAIIQQVRSGNISQWDRSTEPRSCSQNLEPCRSD